MLGVIDNNLLLVCRISEATLNYFDKTHKKDDLKSTSGSRTREIIVMWGGS